VTPPLHAEAVRRGVGLGTARFTLAVELFTVATGTRVAVVGPSGCGKSTLLGLLSLALKPDAGSALDLAGADALALWRAGRADALAALRARHIGFVPQTGALLPFLTLRENIALPQRLAGRPDPARLLRLAERLDIAAILDRVPAAVSVGQRQRAAIARALSHRPGVILADEPTASVHPTQADAILELLTGLAEDEGAALVITTHDIRRVEAAGFALVPCDMVGDTATTHIAWPA